MQFRDVEELDLDPEFMKTYLQYFEEHFQKKGKFRMAFESIDHCYKFHQTFFREAQVSFRLYRNDRDKQNFFS